METHNADVGTIQMEVAIAASAHDVWVALTQDIGRWWPDDFYAGGTTNERDFLIEAHPGGRMYEEWNAGGGVLWGTVVAIDPEKSLQIVGNLFPNWGGPSEWYGSWTLEQSGEATVLTFSESSIGKVTADGLKEKDQGWQFLWSALKAHVEGKPEPAWQG